MKQRDIVWGMFQGVEGVNVGMETGDHGGLLINPLFTLHWCCLLFLPEASLGTETSDFASHLFHVTC